MCRTDFCVTKDHIGRKTIRVYGRRVRLPFRVRTEDVGRRICFAADGTVQLTDIEITAERYPHIHAICSSINLSPVQPVMHRLYAIGDPEHEYEVTPWFATITDLEKWCSRNFGAYFPQIRMAQ
jgi:hypothetical protein